MTENNTHFYPTTEHGNWNPQPPKPKRQWFKNPLVWLPAVALLLGLGIGASTAKTETVEVTKEVQVPGPERIKTVTKEVEVPTTPAECIEYIRLSEQAFDISAEAVGQAAKLNAAGINTQTEKLKGIAPSMMAAKAACRAS